MHELTQENPFLDGTCQRLGDELRMLPYAGMPEVSLRLLGAASFEFTERGSWHAITGYEWERARGYPASESLFAPGEWTVELSDDAELTVLVGLHRTEPPRAADKSSLDPKAPTPAPQRFAAKLAAQRVSSPCAARAGVWPSWRATRVVRAWERDTFDRLPGIYLGSGDFEPLRRSRRTGSGRVGGPPNIPAMAAPPSTPPRSNASLLFARTVQWFAAITSVQRGRPLHAGGLRVLERASPTEAIRVCASITASACSRCRVATRLPDGRPDRRDAGEPRAGSGGHRRAGL